MSFQVNYVRRTDVTYFGYVLSKYKSVYRSSDLSNHISLFLALSPSHQGRPDIGAEMSKGTFSLPPKLERQKL